MWVVDDGRNVLAYELDTGRRLPHKDIDTLAVGFEHISAFSRRTSVGIRSPLGIHIGDAGSAFPKQWPRTLPSGCVETTPPPGAFDDPDPQSIPPEQSECQRYGRMMWVVDANEDTIYTVRLHPDLFDETVPEDFAPQRASMRVTGHRELTVSWQAPVVGSAGVSGWQVQWREQATTGQTPAAWTVVDIDDPSQRSYTIKDLTRGTAYEARVLAVYTDGSTSVHSETAGATAIEQPGQISLKVIPDVGLLALSWKAPSDGGGTITSYQVEHKLATESDYTTVYITVDGDSPTALTHTIEELENDTRYDVRVRAVNAAGGGDWSATVTAAPGEQTVLAAAKAAAKVAADSSDDYKLIELTFNRALDATNLPPPALFGVTVDNAAAATPAVVAVVADDDNVVNTVVLTMATEIAAGVPVTVSYTDPPRLRRPDRRVAERTRRHRRADVRRRDRAEPPQRAPQRDRQSAELGPSVSELGQTGVRRRGRQHR